MGSGTSTVLIVGWHELDEHPSSVPHYRHMDLLRERISHHLRSMQVPHRKETVSRRSDDRSAARGLIDRLPTLDRPIVVCCEWDLDPDDFSQLEHLHHAGDARVLLVSTSEVRLPLPAVVYRQAETGGDVARHCVAAGYRRILYFSPFRTAWADARAEGVAAAALYAGIPVQIEPSVAAPLDWQHLRQDSLEQTQRLRRALKRGLAALPPGDEEDLAIIACNDRVALALRAVQPRLRCGLAGFDDDPAAAHQDLTTVRPPAEELAKRTAEMAARLWRAEPIPTLTEMPWDLVARGSTSRVRPPSVILPPAATRRIDNATILGDLLVPCPPVVVLTWGEVTGLDANTHAHSLRLQQSVAGLMAALQHEHIDAAVLPIDLIGEPGAIARRMERAVRRVISGGAKALIIQELILPAEAEATLAAEQAAGRLHIVRSMSAWESTSTINDQPTVLFDQVSAGTLAATHCLRQRYKRLIYLSPFSTPWAAERGLSVRRALLLASAGLSTLVITPEVPEFDHGGFLRLDAAAQHRLVAEAFDAGCARMAKLPGENGPPAVIAANDDVALLLLDELESRGLRSGVEFGIVGFDDLPESAARGLTSLAPPMTAMGNELARVISRLLAGGTVPRRTCLPWTLAARQSSMQEHPPG